MARETRGWDTSLEKQLVNLEDEELFSEGLRKGTGKQRTERWTRICGKQDSKGGDRTQRRRGRSKIDIDTFAVGVRL